MLRIKASAERLAWLVKTQAGNDSFAAYTAEDMHAPASGSVGNLEQSTAAWNPIASDEWGDELKSLALNVSS